ncbi:MAG TPA: hypothetical protein VED40_15160 [Azospirillaceae bacterium]|nr:hypothetical protein [Azospirillaceae bacterium]
MLLKGRSYQFDVMVMLEGRWQMLCHGPEENLAIIDARKALASGKVQAVKVVQHRTMLLMGTSTERVIFEEKAPPAAERPIAVSNAPRNVEVCGTVQDMFGPASRRAIAHILREYFTKMNLTPTELLHGWSHQKKLQDTGSLLLSAVQRVGTEQARITGEPARQRCNTLDGLIGEVLTLSRDFTAERKRLPEFTAKDIGGYSATIRGIVGDQRHDHVMLSMMTIALADHRSLMGKLEAVLAWSDAAPQLDPLFDGIVADIVCFGEVIKELFGNQPNFGSFLIALADVLANWLESLDHCPTPILTQIVDRLHAGRFPQTRAVLMERLVAEIGSDKALNRLDPSSDQKLLERLVGRLKGPDGTLTGGEAVSKAIDARRNFQRQQFLRSRGLGAIADNM